MSRQIILIPLNAKFPEIDLGEVSDLAVILEQGQTLTFSDGKDTNGYCRIDSDATDYLLCLKNL